jgi:FkbM family methyltransferase
VYANPPFRELLVWSHHLGPGSSFIDVGAGVGVYTVWAIEHGAVATAIEPNPIALRSLRQNMALNGYQPRILEIALADHDGEMAMTFDLDVANHLMQQLEDDRSQDVRLVPVTTLDAIIDDGEIDGVKIDVEGAERLVLKGGIQALSEHRIKLLELEWNFSSMKVAGHDRGTIADFLLAQGYEILEPDVDGRLHPTTDFSFRNTLFARSRDAIAGPNR